MARRALIAALLLGLVGGVGGGLVRAGDGEAGHDLAGMDAAATGEVMRRRPPTPELTRAILEGRSRWFLRFAIMQAIGRAKGEEALNVAGHTVALGLLSKDTWSALSFLCTSDVVIEGAVRGITHPDRHVYVVELDLSRVLAGKVELRPEDTPVRVQVDAMGDHVRWITMDPALGTAFVLFASEGEVLYERQRRFVRGLSAWGGHGWVATGRESAILQLLEPLGMKDPAALLKAMRAPDETRRWLATARAIEVCRDLGSPFKDQWRRRHFDKDILDPIRPQVISGLEALPPNLSWDAKGKALMRPAAPDSK